MAAPDLPRPDGDADVPDGGTHARDADVPAAPAVPRTDGPARDAEGLDIFDDPTHDESAAPARSSRLGVVVLVLAVVLLALDGLAIALLAGDGVTAAASIALVTMLASIAVGVVALVAVATRRGRWPAVAAVLLSVLANPFVFVWLLGRLVPSL
jgi:K+-sensing histidine kinase KdpD